MMPEQSVYPQVDIESDQQIILRIIKGVIIYENNRYCGSGWIQCRN